MNKVFDMYMSLRESSSSFAVEESIDIGIGAVRCGQSDMLPDDCSRQLTSRTLLLAYVDILIVSCYFMCFNLWDNLLMCWAIT